MYILTKLILHLFPLVALILLIIGIKQKSIYYVISSLWLSLIAVIIHFESSGRQILGDYFNYANAAIYSLNLMILFISLTRIISHLSFTNSIFKYVSSLLNSFIVIGCLLVITNIWINAYFLHDRMQGTPIMQVALSTKPKYCSYKYIYYKIANDGSVDYLCPDHYGLIASIGRLSISPDFIATQLPAESKKQMLLQHQSQSR